MASRQSGLDVYHIFPERQEQPNPAGELINIGGPAVEQLVRALDDQRLSRCVTPDADQEKAERILTVGECSELVLEAIAGKVFRPTSGPGGGGFIVNHSFPNNIAQPESREAAVAWAKEFQTKGEKQMIVEEISAGQTDPDPPMAILRKKFPDAVEDAILSGYANAKERWVVFKYLDQLGALNTQRAADALLNTLKDNADGQIRLTAAIKLSDQGNPAVLPIVKRIWREFPVEHAEAPNWKFHYPAGFDVALDVLLASGETDAVSEVVKSWDKRWPSERFEIVQKIFQWTKDPDLKTPPAKGVVDWTSPWPQKPATSVPGKSATSAPRKPMEKTALALSTALLAHALDDKEIAAQNSPRFPQLGHSSPLQRTCDIALSFLKILNPALYDAEPPKEGESLESQCANAAEQWRRSQEGPDNPLADINLARLFSWKGSRITDVQVIRAPGSAVPAFESMIQDLRSNDFTAETLPSICRWLACNVIQDVAGVDVKATRGAGQTNVQLTILLEPGSYPEHGNWDIRHGGHIGATTLENYIGTTPLSDARERKCWDGFIKEVEKGLDAPLDAEFEINARLEAY